MTNLVKCSLYLFQFIHSYASSLASFSLRLYINVQIEGHSEVFFRYLIQYPKQASERIAAVFKVLVSK